MMKYAIIPIIIGMLALSVPPAEAALITIEITAEVDSVRDEANYLDGQINVGDIITGTYTYDSDTTDSNPLSTLGRYEHYAPPCGISLSVGGFDFETDTTNVDFLVAIANNYASGGIQDGYLLISYNNLPLSNGTLVDLISWQLDDPTATALSSDALPTTPPVLDDWQSIVGLRLQGERMESYLIDAHVTSAVPEPTSVLLFALGILLLRKRN